MADGDSLADFTEYRKCKIESFKVELAKVESEEKKLVERLQLERRTFLELQERHREARWKADMVRTEARCLEDILQSLENKNDVLGETSLQLQSKILIERDVNNDLKMCQFEEQMAGIASLLHDARRDYTESNLKCEKKRALEDLEEITMLGNKQMQEVDELRKGLGSLKMDALEMNYEDEKQEDDTFEMELANVIDLFEEENRRYKTVFANYSVAAEEKY